VSSMYVHAKFYMFESVCVSLHLCMCVIVYVPVYGSVLVFASMSLCNYTCACMCVIVYAPVYGSACV
jgi:hypothetical protein